MKVSSREENQQLAALVAIAVATGFCHFRTYYKLKNISIYIWMDSRLKGLSIESKNTQIGLRTKNLWPSEVVDKSKKICSSEQYPRVGVPEHFPHFSALRFSFRKSPKLTLKFSKHFLWTIINSRDFLNTYLKQISGFPQTRTRSILG